jgi:hypothetical protein
LNVIERLQKKQAEKAREFGTYYKRDFKLFSLTFVLHKSMINSITFLRTEESVTMHKAASDIDRVTISLPHSFASEIEIIRSQLNVSRSEIFKRAMEQYIEQQKKNGLQLIAAEMAEEYRTNRDLVFCTNLDSEDFV